MSYYVDFESGNDKQDRLIKQHGAPNLVVQVPGSDKIITNYTLDWFKAEMPKFREGATWWFVDANQKYRVSNKNKTLTLISGKKDDFYVMTSMMAQLCGWRVI